jgi:hypothetical protein
MDFIVGPFITGWFSRRISVAWANVGSTDVSQESMHRRMCARDGDVAFGAFQGIRYRLVASATSSSFFVLAVAQPPATPSFFKSLAAIPQGR